MVVKEQMVKGKESERRSISVFFSVFIAQKKMSLLSFLPVDILVLGIIYKPDLDPDSDLHLVNFRKFSRKQQQRPIKFKVCMVFTVLISKGVSLHERRLYCNYPFAG